MRVRRAAFTGDPLTIANVNRRKPLRTGPCRFAVEAGRYSGTNWRHGGPCANVSFSE